MAKAVAPMKTAAEDKDHGPANMTADMQLQYQIPLSDSKTEAMTWSLGDMVFMSNQLESEIYAITSNEQKGFKKEFCIPLIKFEAWWETIGIQVLRKTIE
jgi:hypothetical protein